MEKAAKKMNKWADLKRRPREDDLLLVKLHFLFGRVQAENKLALEGRSEAEGL